MKSLKIMMAVAWAGITVSAMAGEAPLQTVALDEVLQAGEVDWSFDNGREFKGATGSLVMLKDQPEAGRNALRLSGNFTGGGAYVQATRKLPELADRVLDSLVLSLRSTNVTRFNVRLIDGTGQCHQRKGVPVTADGQWHDVVLKPSEIAGGEHWSGANDGQWHGALSLVAIMVGKADTLQPVIDFARPRAMVADGGGAPVLAFRENFDSAAVPAGWETAGDVAAGGPQPFAGSGALKIVRPLEQVNQPARAAGPVILEPVMSCEILCPEAYMGGVIGDLNSRRGKILNMSVRHDLQAIKAEVPLGTMFGYSTALRSSSQGRATFSMEFSHYEPVPEQMAHELKVRAGVIIE